MPVSSTGHLLLVQRFFGFADEDFGKTFAVLIQFGAILALLSLIFVFTSLFERTIAGIGIGMVLSLPIGVGLTALELIVILVQAYVFTLLTAVFIGMAIHAHH